MELLSDEEFGLSEDELSTEGENFYAYLDIEPVIGEEDYSLEVVRERNEASSSFALFKIQVIILGIHILEKWNRLSSQMFSQPS